MSSEDDTPAGDGGNSVPNNPDAAASGGPLPGAGTANSPESLTHRVIARSGLLMRSGPGTEFPPIRSLPFGTPVSILKREGQWALVDVVGDNAADGFVFMSFLDDGTGTGPARPVAVSPPQAGDFVPLKKALLQTIMNRCAGMTVRSSLDLDVVADALTRSMIKAKATTRLREVGFLSQAVMETDYFKTFHEYGSGHGKDYYPYYGRGMHQLTWEVTYAACSQALYGDDRLVADPDLILKDIEVNIAATAWFWRDYKPFNTLADAGDIDEIIHRLYGGKITSPNPDVRKSVTLRRSFYKIIGDLLDQHAP